MITGMSLLARLIFRTTATSSSSRTQGLSALAFEMTTTTAFACPSPSSKIFRTKLSPGRISHRSSQASMPRARRRAAKSRTNALSSEAWLMKTLGAPASVMERRLSCRRQALCSSARRPVKDDPSRNGKKERAGREGTARLRGKLDLGREGAHALDEGAHVAAAVIVGPPRPRLARRPVGGKVGHGGAQRFPAGPPGRRLQRPRLPAVIQVELHRHLPQSRSHCRAAPGAADTANYSAR